MSNNFDGQNVLDLLTDQCKSDVLEFQKKLLLNPNKVKDIEQLIKTIEGGSFRNTKEQGDALESLTKITLQHIGLFEMFDNIHTSSNEIDFLCSLNSAGKTARAQGYIEFETDFLIECKNYSTKVDVTYVGKFASLLNSTSKNFGIVISKHGITGNGWNDALGLTKKLYLKSNILIISFTLSDFKKLNEISFFELIQIKKQEIINDVDLSPYIKKHPAEK